MSVPLTPKLWEDRIKQAEQRRRDDGLSADWDQYLGCYNGRFPTVQDGRDNQSIVVNKIRANARTMMSQIIMRNPYLTVIPRQPNYAIKALIREATLNPLMRQMGLDNQIERAVLNAYWAGTGILKVGFDREFGFNPERTGAMAVGEDGEIIGELPDASATREGKDGEQIEYDSEIRPGMPWVKSVNPKDFLTDDSLDITDASWCAHRYIRPLADIMADKLFKNKATLKSNVARGGLFHRIASAILPDGKRLPEDEPVECWEIHDKKTQKVYVIATDHDKFLYEGEDVLQVGGRLPFVVLVFNLNPEAFWGTSDISIQLPQQLELNEAREQIRMQRRLAGLRLLVRRGAISKDEAAKFFTDRPIPIIEMEDISGKELINIPIPGDLSGYAAMISQDMDDQIGLSRQERGGVTQVSHAPTAYEIGVAHDAAQGPIGDRRFKVTECIIQVMALAGEFCDRFWTEERAASVIGPDGASVWVKYNMGDIQGEYEFEVNPETGANQTGGLRRQELLQFIQALGQTPIFQTMQPQQLQALMRQLLKLYPTINMAEIMPQNPTMQEPMSVDGLQQKFQDSATQQAQGNEVAQFMAQMQAAQEQQGQGGQGGGANAGVSGPMPAMPQGAGVPGPSV